MKKLPHLFPFRLCKCRLLLPLCALCLFLSGCGKDPALEAFRQEMETFYESLSAAQSAFDAIDPASDDAGEALLAQLDQMSLLFAGLAEQSIPAQFADTGMEELADEASTYMAEAASLYRQAFSEEVYNAAIADAARENYSRAMKRVTFIADIMQGKVPDDDSVVVVSEEEPDWNGGEETP